MNKSIVLKRLSINNFKGVRHLEINFGAAHTNIYGDNATGKTTIADALTWLLFGKDSHNQTQFNIKPLDESGEVAQHGVESSVTAEFEIDGQTVELGRTYAEKWTKKRGASKEVLSGHETKYFIDGVPTTQRDYKAYIADVVDENTFRLLTDPAYFASVLSWEDRRKILFSLTEDLTDEQVIDANPELAPLSEYVQRPGLDKLAVKLKADRKRMNRERDEIPIRIDEAMGTIREDIDRTAEEREIVDLDAQISALQDELADVSANSISPELAQIGNDIVRLKDEKNARIAQVSDAYRAALEAFTRESGRLRYDAADAESEAKALDAKIARCTSEANALRAEYHDVKATEWTGETICPTCGQAFPEEKIDEMREHFNLDKSRRLEDVVTRGKAAKAAAEAMTAQRDKLLADAQAANEELAHLEAPAEQYADTSDLDAQIERLEERRAQLRSETPDPGTAAQSIRAQMRTLEAEIQTHRANLAALDANEATRARIEDLKQSERKLSGEIEKTDALLALLEDFTRARVRMTEDAINGRFDIVSFRLFRTLVNGGIEECCDVTVDGVPWADLNSAARVNAGLDIIRTLSEHYGVHAPVVVDNAEGVTHLRDDGMQTVRLIVSEPDKTLRVQEAA